MSVPLSPDKPKLTRRGMLKASLASTALMKMVHTATAAEEKHNRPNILFLMGDQHRGDCLGADGNRVVITPNLDRLAREGARFRCAYTSVPSCTPARAGILTGLSPWRHGMLGYGRIAPEYPRELPRLIRAAGYYTLGIGKMHFHPQRNTHGYDRTILDESGRVESAGFVSDYRRWFRSVAPDLDPDATGIGWNDHRAKAYVLSEHLHPTSWTGAEAVKFLEDYKDTRPFLLKVSFARPHSPYDPPPRWWKRYQDAQLPERVIGAWAERHAQWGKPYRNDLWQGDLGAEKVRQARQGYYGNVSFIDEQIGRMLEVLEKRGLLENTLILYTADHGDMTGDHHLWRKTYAYEASARIPIGTAGAGPQPAGRAPRPVAHLPRRGRRAVRSRVVRRPQPARPGPRQDGRLAGVDRPGARHLLRAGEQLDRPDRRAYQVRLLCPRRTAAVVRPPAGPRRNPRFVVRAGGSGDAADLAAADDRPPDPARRAVCGQGRPGSPGQADALQPALSETNRLSRGGLGAGRGGYRRAPCEAWSRWSAAAGSGADKLPLTPGLVVIHISCGLPLNVRAVYGPCPPQAVFGPAFTPGSLSDASCFLFL
jgi:hypothetical protein